MIDHDKPLSYIFSWQEMAEFDLPAMIDYVLHVTGQSQVFYVGHSQGSLIGFTGFSFNKILAKKIKIFFALAPVYTLAHCSDFIKGAAYVLYPVEVASMALYNGTLLDRNTLLSCTDHRRIHTV
jgi:lysosomal acid lipase/cholesteryl ester hydrolase